MMRSTPRPHVLRSCVHPSPQGTFFPRFLLGILLLGTQLALLLSPACPSLSNQESHILFLETLAPSPPWAPLCIEVVFQVSERRLWLLCHCPCLQWLSSLPFCQVCASLSKPSLEAWGPPRAFPTVHFKAVHLWPRWLPVGLSFL